MIQEYYTTKYEKGKHLTTQERAKIEILLRLKVKKKEIAKELKISRSTLYEEIKCVTVDQKDTNLKIHRIYFAETGQLVYEEHRKKSVKPYKYVECFDFIQYIEYQIINNKMAPDTLCGCVCKNKLFEHTVCTKTIYNYIDLGLLKVKNIDLPQKVKLKHKNLRVRRNKRILGKSIEERPENINNRTEFGHWEIDTVIGTKESSPVLLTLDERVTRKLIAVKIEARTVEAVNVAIQRIINTFNEDAYKIFKSITADNGSEFACLSESVKCTTDVYFAHPYSSFE